MTRTSIRTCWIDWITVIQTIAILKIQFYPVCFPPFPSNVLFPEYNVGISQKPHAPYFSALSIFLAISPAIPGPYMDRSRRVSMTAWIFSPNDNNFCQFMTPNLPKPMFLAQIHLGLVGALAFYISQN